VKTRDFSFFRKGKKIFTRVQSIVLKKRHLGLGVGCPHPNPNPHPNTLTPKGTYPKPIPKYSKKPIPIPRDVLEKKSLGGRDFFQRQEAFASNKITYNVLKIRTFLKLFEK